MKLLKELDVKNKTVLLRTEFNVPVRDGKVHDDYRIRAVLPTIEYLREQGSKIVILSHRGRPAGKVVPELSLQLVASHLSTLLGIEVKLVDDDLNDLSDKISKLESGEIIMLENLRFHSGEEKNNKAFARTLASLGDCYVNDAFGVAHRAHASQSSIPALIPSSAGFLLEKEIEVLDNIREKAARPFVIVMGGAKVRTKIKVVHRFLEKADAICIGGIIANTILSYKGVPVGKSKYEKGLEKYIDKISLTDTTLHLPVDVVVSKDASGKKPIRTVAISNVDNNDMILDIGEETQKLFSNIALQAGTIVWNGPFGVFEVEAFAEGTRNFAKSLKNSNAYIVIGGGDVIDAVRELGLDKEIDFISTGGGAMLEYLAGEKLPGIEALM